MLKSSEFSYRGYGAASEARFPWLLLICAMFGVVIVHEVFLHNRTPATREAHLSSSNLLSTSEDSPYSENPPVTLDSSEFDKAEAAVGQYGNQYGKQNKFKNQALVPVRYSMLGSAAPYIVVYEFTCKGKQARFVSVILEGIAMMATINKGLGLEKSLFVEAVKTKNVVNTCDEIFLVEGYPNSIVHGTRKNNAKRNGMSKLEQLKNPTYGVPGFRYGTTKEVHYYKCQAMCGAELKMLKLALKKGQAPTVYGDVIGSDNGMNGGMMQMGMQTGMMNQMQMGMVGAGGMMPGAGMAGAGIGMSAPGMGMSAAAAGMARMPQAGMAGMSMAQTGMTRMQQTGMGGMPQAGMIAGMPQAGMPQAGMGMMPGRMQGRMPQGGMMTGLETEVSNHGKKKADEEHYAEESAKENAGPTNHNVKEPLYLNPKDKDRQRISLPR